MKHVLRGNHRCIATGDVTPYEATYLHADGTVAWSARVWLGATSLVVSACDDAPAGDRLSAQEIVVRSVGRMIDSIRSRSH